jgi:hypothetical protein
MTSQEREPRLAPIESLGPLPSRVPVVLQTSQPLQNTTTHEYAEILPMNLDAKHLIGALLPTRLPPGAANVDNAGKRLGCRHLMLTTAAAIGLPAYNVDKLGL